MIGLLCLILVFSHFILRLIIVGPEKKVLSEDGRLIDLWGKIILSALGIIIIFLNYDEIETLKWFWLLLIIVAFGFQSFVDWKYQKDSKQYIVSLIVLVMGVGLVNFLL